MNIDVSLHLTIHGIKYRGIHSLVTRLSRAKVNILLSLSRKDLACQGYVKRQIFRSNIIAVAKRLVASRLRKKF
jgi:hypothetical protein